MNKKFAYTFIDFDETLFRTEELKKSFFAVVQPYGVTAEDFWTTIAVAENQNHSATYYDYTFDKHIAKLRAKGYDVPDKAIAELSAVVVRSRAFVFADAFDFLDAMRCVTEKMLLLSSGNHGFQMAKIEATGLASLFDQIIIVHDRKEAVVDRVSVQGTKPTLFVNDNLEENRRVQSMVPGVTVISKKNTVKFALDEYEKSGIPVFESLADIKKWIEAGR